MSSQKWICGVCTLENEPLHLVCNVCLTERISPTESQMTNTRSQSNSHTQISPGSRTSSSSSAKTTSFFQGPSTSARVKRKRQLQESLLSSFSRNQKSPDEKDTAASSQKKSIASHPLTLTTRKQIEAVPSAVSTTETICAENAPGTRISTVKRTGAPAAKIFAEMQEALYCRECSAPLRKPSTCKDCHAQFCGQCTPVINANQKCTCCKQPSRLLRNDVLGDISCALESFLRQTCGVQPQTSDANKHDNTTTSSPTTTTACSDGHVSAGPQSLAPKLVLSTDGDKHPSAETSNVQASQKAPVAPAGDSSVKDTATENTSAHTGSDAHDCERTVADATTDRTAGSAIAPANDTTLPARVTRSSTHLEKPSVPPHSAHHHDDYDFVESPDFKRRVTAARRRPDKVGPTAVCNARRQAPPTASEACMHTTAAHALHTLTQAPLQHGYTGARKGTLETAVVSRGPDVQPRVHVLTDASDPAGESYVIHVPGFWRSRNESSPSEFQQHWDLHPSTVATIVLAGKVCNEARWKRAYGQSYFYAGAWSEARAFAEYPVLPQMLNVVRNSICPRANSALVNWYDTEHSIGAHADDESNLCDGCPVVSISWGFHRTFRLRPINPKEGCHVTQSQRKSLDLSLGDGDLVIMGGALQKTHKHEVCRLPADVAAHAAALPFKGRRINVTFRAMKPSKQDRG
eukprot:m.464895 g.464895  ORF g.464895 m.464895 type:complete len:690 (-) comp21625_c0_seq3:270-2339(-)